MAVYTHLTIDQLRGFARQFQLGELRAARGVAAGTINTLYDLRTSQGRFFLRVLEGRPARDADYEAALLFHLQRAGLPVPELMPTTRDERRLALGPRQHVSVFRFMPGSEIAPKGVTAGHAAQVGGVLARLHLAGRDFPRRRANPFGPPRLRRLLARCQRVLSQQPQRFTPRHARDLQRIERVLVRSGAVLDRALPSGVIHGDLFTDNVKFNGARLRGVIDFEMASSGPWAYDLAVALCEWAYRAPSFVPTRARALLAAYARTRSIARSEVAALPALLRYVAMRFALTRFHDFEAHQPADAHRLVKDYREYMARLDAEVRFRPQLQAMLQGVVAG